MQSFHHAALAWLLIRKVRSRVLGLPSTIVPSLRAVTTAPDVATKYMVFVLAVSSGVSQRPPPPDSYWLEKCVAVLHALSFALVLPSVVLALKTLFSLNAHGWIDIQTITQSLTTTQ